MEENKDLDKAPASITEKFKMEPPAGAWNTLDADLERLSATRYKKSANRFRLLSIGLALLLLSFISFYYLNTPQQLKTVTVASEKAVTPQNKNMSGSSSNNQPRKTNNAPVAVSSPNNNHSPVHEKALIASSEIKKISKAVSSLKPKQEAGFNLATKEESVLAEHKALIKDEHVNNLIANSDQDISKNGIAPEPAKVEIRDEELSSRTNNADLKASERNVTTALGKNDMAISSTPTENNNIINGSVSKDFTGDNSSASSPPPSLSPETAKADQTTPVKVESGKDSAASIAAIDSTRITHWSLSAFYSPHYSRNRLSDNNGYDSENPADYTTHEKSSYSFSTGLALRYHLNERWSISAGAAYSTMAYSISIPTVYTRTGSDNLVHYTYPTSCGIVVMPNSSGKYIHNNDTIPVNAGCDQILKFIRVPLIVRFQIPLNSLLVYAEAGASANFLLEEKSVVRYGTAETTIVNNTEGLKKRNYSYQLGIGIEYRFYKKMGVFIEPVYTAAITSLTENISLNCYPYSFGLNAGLSFHF